MFKIPQVKRTLDLADAGEGYAGAVEVWVNPPRRISDQWSDLVKRGGELSKMAYAKIGKQPGEKLTGDEQVALDAADEKLLAAWETEYFAWLAAIWGIEPDEVAYWRQEADQAIWNWMVTQTWAMIRAYREEIAGPK